MIFERGVHFRFHKQRGGGPGGGLTLGPMLKSLQRGQNLVGGGVRTPWNRHKNIHFTVLHQVYVYSPAINVHR